MMSSTAPSPTTGDPGGIEIERIPWSVAGPGFIEIWGRSDPSDPQPEHMEIIGQNGAGKTFLLAQIDAEMVRRRKSSIVFVATKKADRVISSMGWPVVQTWRETQQHDQVVFWPQTSLTGSARQEYQAGRIQELLDNLWGADANTLVEFDEFAYLEGLNRDLRATLQMYLREGRSHGITVVAGKQRVQGVQRDMHSETRVTIGFHVKDHDDQVRLAEVFGNRKEMLPVIKSLDKSRREFVLKHDPTDTMIISWVDKPIDLAKRAQHQKSYRKSA